MWWHRSLAVIVASLILFASQAWGQQPVHRVGVPGSPRRAGGEIGEGFLRARACNASAHAWLGLLRSFRMRSRFALHAGHRRGTAPRLAGSLGSSPD